MKKAKTIALWTLSGFFIISALVYFPSFSSLFAILMVGLIVPIPMWQEIIVKFVRGKLKIIIAIVLALLTLWTAPTTDDDTETDPTAPITTEYAPTTDADTETDPTAPITTEYAAITTVDTTTEPTTTPTTEPPHTHSFSAATCTAPRTCSCGATEGSANGHNWKEATCIAPKTCTSCNITEGTTTEHSWKEATYTSPKTCTTCGATEGNPLDVPGKENYHGHVYAGGDSGTKYHYEADCAGKYSHEITWEEVENQNLGPCGTCVLK